MLHVRSVGVVRDGRLFLCELVYRLYVTRVSTILFSIRVLLRQRIFIASRYDCFGLHVFVGKTH